MKIIILGAGVGGLSCATQLAKYENEIIVVDRNCEIGGLARTYCKNEKNYHTEICWKAVAAGYVDFLELMNKITDQEGVKVISHLKPLVNFIYAFNDRIVTEEDNSFLTRVYEFEKGFKQLYGRSISISDRLFLYKIVLIATFASDSTIFKYDSVLWKDYTAGISPELSRWIVDSTAIYLGMEYDRISAAFIFMLLRTHKKSKLIDNKYVFYSFDGPMSEVLFDPWQDYLEKQGVKFYLETEVTEIRQHNNTIIEVILNDGVVLTGDVYINSMDCGSLAQLIPTIKNLALPTAGEQLQAQVLFYLDEPLSCASGTIVIFPDSPWFLMTRVESSLWEIDHELLSTGIGIWNRVGNNGKLALECTREELAQECWTQMVNSQTNLQLPATMPEWDIWYTFQYNEAKGELMSRDLKFSNNINTLALRPNYKDSDISNLYHANAYTRTEMNVYNMGAAAESGVKVGKLIMKEKISNESETNCLLRFIRKFF
jgi:NAD(P)-binding Rossmann-like domain